MPCSIIVHVQPQVAVEFLAVVLVALERRLYSFPEQFAHILHLRGLSIRQGVRVITPYLAPYCVFEMENIILLLLLEVNIQFSETMAKIRMAVPKELL